MSSLLLTATIAALSWSYAGADMFNLVDSRLVPPSTCGPSGCAAWGSLNATIQSWWSGGKLRVTLPNLRTAPYAPGLSKPSPLLDPSAVGGQGVMSAQMISKSGAIARALIKFPSRSIFK